MESGAPFNAESDETRSQMLRATYDALQVHGYAELTIQRIADEFPKSKSLIYQHYGGKDELLVDFLELLLEQFETVFEEDRSHDAPARLERLLDHMLSPGPEGESFVRAMTALRGEAPYNDAFRARFTETDRVIRGQVESIVRQGIDDGVFNPVDETRVATFVVTTLQGAGFHRSTTDDGFDEDALRRELEDYLESRLGPDAVR